MNTTKITKVVSQLLIEFKQEFREWYGNLSVEEIMSNPELVKHIERVERIIATAAHTSR